MHVNYHKVFSQKFKIAFTVSSTKFKIEKSLKTNLWLLQYWWLKRLTPIDFNESEETPLDWDWPQPATQQDFPWNLN